MTTNLDTASTKSAADGPFTARSELSDFLDVPPSICIYGSAGMGKSTEAGIAFPHALFLLSNKAVIRPFVSWIRDNQKEAEAIGATPPLPLIDSETGRPNKIEFDTAKNQTVFTHRDPASDPKDKNAKMVTVVLKGVRRGAYIAIPEFTEDHDKDGHPIRFNNWSTVVTYGNAFIRRVRETPWRYDACIVDEGSMFMSRAFEDIKADKRFKTDAGKQNTFKAQNELHVFQRWLGKYIPEQSKKPFLLLCHEAAPRYFDEENDPRYGRLRVMGGPKLPMGSLIEALTADMDIVLQLTMSTDVDGNRRVYRTAADPLWARKFRDFGVKAEEPIGLRALLQKAQFPLGNTYARVG